MQNEIQPFFSAWKKNQEIVAWKGRLSVWFACVAICAAGSYPAVILVKRLGGQQSLIAVQWCTSSRFIPGENPPHFKLTFSCNLFIIRSLSLPCSSCKSAMMETVTSSSPTSTPFSLAILWRWTSNLKAAAMSNMSTCNPWSAKKKKKKGSLCLKKN